MVPPTSRGWLSAPPHVLHGVEGIAHKFAGRVVLGRVANVDQVVRRAPAGVRIRLGGADVHVPIDDGLGPIGGLDHPPDEPSTRRASVPRTTLFAALLLAVGSVTR